jgi:hypothetical protein
MQPRRVRVEEDGETVFQVTNKGDSVMEVEARWEVRRGCRPMGTKELEEEAGVVLVVDGERELEEEDAGVELPLKGGREEETRSRVGFRGAGREEGGLDSLSEGEEGEDDAESGSSSSSSSRPLG